MRVLVLAFLAAAGCATATPVATGVSTHPASVSGDDEGASIRLSEEPEFMSAPVNASPEKVWAAMPLVYEKLEVTGAKVLDSEAQTLRRPRLHVEPSRGNSHGRFRAMR
jgi:hypothetical protein